MSIIRLALLFFLCFYRLNAYENFRSAGTLIVSYRTFPEKERLERIRFWLRDEEGKQTLYPKENHYIDDPRNGFRITVIENVKPGTYALGFIVPNVDGFFEKVRERKVTVKKGETVRVDQTIKPALSSTATLRLVTNVDAALFSLRTLDESAEWKGQGKNFLFRQLKPGSYRLSFYSQDPNYYLPPPEEQIFVEADQNYERQRDYQLAGKLVIRANASKFWAYITSLDHPEIAYREEILRNYDFLYLPEGKYTVVFENSKGVKTPAKEIYLPSLHSVELQVFFKNKLLDALKTAL